MLFAGIFSAHFSFAQVKEEWMQSRILILLDESSSMIHTWPGGKPKYRAADELILSLMDSVYAVNNQVEFSLRVFGHQYTTLENNCYDTKNEVAFAKDNRIQMDLRLTDIHPLGVTPIAYALSQAAEFDIVEVNKNAYSIILITDGGESCGGDICDVMKRLLQSKVLFKPYIVSLEDDASLKNVYSCIGDYLQVTKNGDIPKAVSTIVNAYRPVLKIKQSDYKQLQAVKANTPSVLNVNIPNIEIAKNIDSIKKATPPQPPKKADTVVKPPVKVKPSPEKISRLTGTPVVKINIAPVRMPVPGPLDRVIPLPEPVIIIPPPPRDNEKIFAATTLRPIQYTIVTGPPITHGPMAVPALPEPVYFIPAPPRVSDKISALAVARPVSIAAPTAPRPAAPQPVLAPALPPFAAEEPTVPRDIAKISPLRLQAAQRVAVVAPTPRPMVAAMRSMPLPPPVYDIPYVPPIEQLDRSPEKIARLKLAAPKTLIGFWVIEDKTLSPRAVPPLPPFKYDAAPPPAVVVAPVQPAKLVKTDKALAPGEMKADFTYVAEEAKETTLEVYFTNGKGKYYATTPQVVLVDPATHKDVKKFYRTVDGEGNPDPQNDIAVGTYNLTFASKRTLVVPNLKIEKDKKNRVDVVVKNTTISFAYGDNRTRPVTEFVAQVIERNKKRGRVNLQKCTEAVEYEPGSYHIEINTFPKDVRYLDLDFDVETIIRIPQPGFAKFTPQTNATKVTLYQRSGDKYMEFATLELDNPSMQHLQIQPGEYQAHYQKGPTKSFASEKVKPFQIRSAQETEIILD